MGDQSYIKLHGSTFLGLSVGGETLLDQCRIEAAWAFVGELS